MTKVIILTSTEADSVRGPSPVDPLSWLDPVPVPDGLWMLPLAVLDDPAHAALRDFLLALPQEELPTPTEAPEPLGETHEGAGRRPATDVDEAPKRRKRLPPTIE